MNKFYLFSKESCGPCMLVDKYFTHIKDNRINIVENVSLEDIGTTPIPQENLELAKKYGVYATPVLIVTDSEGYALEEFVGGLGITQNIRRLLKKYA